MDFFIDQLLDIAKSNGSARHEVKFVIPRPQILRLRQWIVNSPLKLLKEHPSRRIASLYLDSREFDCYNDNIEGTSQRVKFRLRHYGHEKPSQLFLETKLRQSQTGYKLVYPISDATLVKAITSEQNNMPNGQNGWIRKLAASPNLHQPLALNMPILIPTVEIAYEREYYVSADRQLRLTIDTSLQYRRAGQTMGKYWNDELTICEIKTKSISKRDPRTSFPSLPFRVSRNSKYCSAVAAVSKELVPKEHWEPYVIYEH